MVWEPGIYELGYDGQIQVDHDLSVTWLSGPHKGITKSAKEWQGWRPEWTLIRRITPNDPYAESDF